MLTSIREIIGDVRFALTTQLKQLYPEMDGARGFMQTTEPYLIRAMYGVDPQARRADYYIAPGDGGGPIVVEVGDTKDESWQELLSLDRQPVRVLQIGLNRVLNLLHPRNTQFEKDLLHVLELGLNAS